MAKVKVKFDMYVDDGVFQQFEGCKDPEGSFSKFLLEKVVDLELTAEDANNFLDDEFENEHYRQPAF